MIHRAAALAFIFLWSAGSSIPAWAFQTAAGGIKIARAPHPLALDPTLADPAWKAGAVPDSAFENITSRAPAKFKTDVWVLYDDTNLYVSFRAEQAGAPITATQTANDIGFGIDDFVGVGIDPGGNGAQVYFFETTPRGIRYQQASENARYRPQWAAAAALDGSTWSAVMVIPLKAMRVSPSAVQSWRLNFVRNVASSGEHYTWAYDGIMQDAPVGTWPFFTDARFWPSTSGIKFTSQVGSRPAAHADLYALGSAGSDRTLFAQANGSFVPTPARNFGVDFTYPITNTINFVGTANPDFSNVEVDQQTIAPQEFRRALVEYRPFFAQGANFINPNPAPVGGFIGPANLLFYSPDIGPFDRGGKIEGSYGKQSFGLLSFRGYDETTGDEFDDLAYGFKHALPDRTFMYWADGVEAHHSVSGDDYTNEMGVAGRNLKTGFVWGLDTGVETGSWVGPPGHADSSNGFVDVHKPNYETFIGFTDLTPNFNPIDGFTINSDIVGPQMMLNFTGSAPGVKNYDLFLYGDRFIDRSGAVHQADTAVNFGATFKNGISLNNVGPAVQLLRSYATVAPTEAIPCDSALISRSYYTGYPGYYCGRTDKFNAMGGGIGYRDGTPAPFDTGISVGPFGQYFVHQYTSSTSRPIGSRFSIALEYDGTYQRCATTLALCSASSGYPVGPLESQWLRRISFGETLGPDANVSISLRNISGIGGSAIPGTNVAASYHAKFRNGSELFFNYGTPAANTTLDRFILKYVFHTGGGAGT
ncbi:MAG: hypothetical protein JOZ38_07470 [Candidatus Eremiobacteraeota bacterium]|nr:hypothetical protein [Candidatus Eremiobacteraeota bacterium]